MIKETFNHNYDITLSSNPFLYSSISGGVGHSARWIVGQEFKMASFATDFEVGTKYRRNLKKSK